MPPLSKLYVIATPIGNLGDTSSRTIEALQACDFILAEDTRVSIKLLSHFGIRKKLFSCHEYNEGERVGLLSEAARDGKSVALMSDAGTPLVSDPGYRIVQEAIALEMMVVPIPGASAFLLALIGSGLPCDRFVFEGFLPDKQTAAKKRLEELQDEQRTLVFYVSPHKLVRTMKVMIELLGNRRGCLARELTKYYEEFLRGTLGELLEIVMSRDILGEFVLVLEGNSKPVAEEVISEESLREEIRTRLKAGQTVRDLSADLAQEFEQKKSYIYKLALSETTEAESETESSSTES